jgi:hypothetical protein
MNYCNESYGDRALRVLIGVLMLATGWGNLVTGVWGIALEVFGWVPLITGMLGWCPVYTLLGVRTCRDRPRQTSP